MWEELLVRYCSPTLAGMKTGSMFACSYGSRGEIWEYLALLNKKLVKRGLRVLPLRMENGRAWIYVYRPNRLKADLADTTAKRLLEERNYSMGSSDRCVVELINRLKSYDEFPHEIGLFLGYPPEDVAGFIANKAANSKCVGAWKVYGDEEAARKTFARYKKCTDVYCTQYARGKSIERLTVAE